MSMRTHWRWVVLLTLLAAATGARAEDRTAHVDAGELLIQSVQPQYNEYAYKDPLIKWKGEDGASRYEARCDCSAFVTLLFEHVYGFTPKQMDKWLGHAPATARDYHDQILAEHGFKRIKLVADIHRGDLIAVQYLVSNKDKDTGHVMIVDEAPRAREAKAPLRSGTTQWDVIIIDSSKSGHGPDDTRRMPDKTYHTGVGRGTIRLYSSSDGQIVGYTWSTLAASEFYPPDKHDVVVGRLLTDFAP
jgi:hypothetical protein